jgi:hypothetical protein
MCRIPFLQCLGAPRQFTLVDVGANRDRGMVETGYRDGPATDHL